MSRVYRRGWWIGWMVFLLLPVSAWGERVKDIASIAGVRSSQLVGYGLVVGLNKTGDGGTNSPFTRQSLANMLKQLGVVLSPSDVQKAKPENIAAVMITATLPPFSKPGQTIDVTVSSVGDASSLRGGALLATPLKGLDGQVYAMAQGNLAVDGFNAFGNDGSSIKVNIPSVGHIPGGATVERSVPTPFSASNDLILNLHSPDFTTATRLAKVINHAIGENAANPIDASSIKVQAPNNPGQRVEFMSMLENLTVEPGETAAKVVINARTGTVVVGRHVRVTPAAVTHGNLTVTVQQRTNVSQPTPLSGGNTVATPESQIQIAEEKRRMFIVPESISLEQIVQAVNQVGGAPSDLVAILQALKEAGALRAQLDII